MPAKPSVKLTAAQFDWARAKGLPEAYGGVWDAMERTAVVRRRGRGTSVTVETTVRQAEALRRWFNQQGELIGGEHNLAFDAAERITLALSDVLI